jgi:hypothetical protein
MKILPSLNTFQEFQLSHEVDGIDGVIKVCIVCEEGKINLNQVFDFKTKKFVGEGQPSGDWKLVLQAIFKKIETMVGGGDLFVPFERFLKKREGKKIEDVTELLSIKEFFVFKDLVYYDPISTPEKQSKKRGALTDIFTVHSKKQKIEPWLLSDGLLALGDIKSLTAKEATQRKSQITTWLQKFKMNSDWKNDWTTILKPVYEKELQSLPKGIESFLSTNFDPRSFSVLVHATVNNVTQYLLAIVERINRSQNGEIVYDSRIKKLYWL